MRWLIPARQARRGGDQVERRVLPQDPPLELSQLCTRLDTEVARLEGPRAIMANHVLDAVDQTGLESFARFARMALSGGGRVYADFYTLEPDESRYQPEGPKDWMRPKPADRVSRALEAAGAVIVHSTQVEATTGRREFAKSDRPVVRMVAEWRK